MPRQSLFDELYEGIVNGIADVRHKVVEEPMWGRAVTDGPEHEPHWPEAREPEPSLGSSTHVREMEPEHDLDLDR